MNRKNNADLEKLRLALAKRITTLAKENPNLLITLNSNIINKIIIMNKLIIIKYNIFLLITTTSFLLKLSGNHQNN